VVEEVHPGCDGLVSCNNQGNGNTRCPIHMLVIFPTKVKLQRSYLSCVTQKGGGGEYFCLCCEETELFVNSCIWMR
jgi:hypothetical protein